MREIRYEVEGEDEGGDAEREREWQDEGSKANESC